MVYTSQQRQENRINRIEVPVLLDPALLRAARQIYRTYAEVHANRMQRPTGVAIHKLTHRGKLIFLDKAILLPQECFVPFSQIESEIY